MAIDRRFTLTPQFVSLRRQASSPARKIFHSPGQLRDALFGICDENSQLQDVLAPSFLLRDSRSPLVEQARHLLLEFLESPIPNRHLLLDRRQ